MFNQTVKLKPAFFKQLGLCLLCFFLLASITLPAQAARNQQTGTPRLHEIAFIESNIANYSTLVRGMDPATEIHVLDAGADGLAQMADILKGRTGIHALHIFSHGSEGLVQLGTWGLTAKNIDARADTLKSIGLALDHSSNILLYGCDVAKGAAGKELMERFAQYTGAQVGASIDPTGAAALGGNWKLERWMGVQHVAALNIPHFPGLLTTPINGTTTFGNSTYYSSTVNASGSGYAVTNIVGSGWDFRVFASSGVVDVVVNVEAFTGATMLAYGGTNTGGTHLTAIQLSSNDPKLFDLNSVQITVDGVNSTYDASSHSIQLVGYRGGSPVAGATLTQLVTNASGGGALVTFDVSSNANFLGIDAFRVVPTGGDYIDGAIGVDNVNATNIHDPVSAPTATTGSASAISATGATLNGTINDNGATTTVTFDYGLTAAYGTNVAATTGGTVNAGAGSTAVARPITGLACNTTYHFRVIGANSAGTTNGSDNTFTTSKCPQIITFTNPGTQSFGTTPTLSATASSGLTPTFTSATTGVCTITVGGALTFVTTGTCTIDADQAGNGTYAAAPTVSQSFTVAAVVPGAPTIGTATAGDAQVSVTFSAPGFNGGAAITSYTATASPGGATGSSATSPIMVTGLTNGTAYTFTVTAANSAGTGSASAASNSATPKGVQTITFGNPGTQNFGTSPTLTATASSGLTPTFTSTTTGVCTITSGGALTFVTTGTCTIHADQAGNGSFNAAPTVPQSFTVNAIVPGAPAIGTATAGDTQASVTFTAPVSNGGATITGYTATASPGGATGTGVASPITVTGLTNGVAYTFTVTATNSAGTSSASAASNSVTPKAAQTITFNNPGTQTFGTTPTLTATATSALAVTFTSSTTGVCTITSGGALTFGAPGNCTINADQAGDASFLPAPQVSQSFAVNAVAPGAPTIGTATAGDTQATVSFTAPVSNGGSVITGYTVTANPGGATGTGVASPITVTGLTNGVAYTFTVTATNSAGTGSASAASNSVTPKAAQTITFNNPGAQTLGTTPTLTATATSALAVTFTSSTPGVCAITGGGTVSFVATGTCTVQADQAGSAAFLAAAPVVQSFLVVATSVTDPLVVGTGSVTATISNVAAGCGFVDAQAIAIPGGAATTAPTNLSFPYGMVAFNVAGSCGNGVTATFTLTYPQNLPANTQFWKYGRTASNTQSHWYQITAASNNLSITNNQISYTVTDGGDGDDDLVANGAIVDPAAPAVPLAAAAVTGIPTLSEWALACLALLLGGLAVPHLKRARGVQPRA